MPNITWRKRIQIHLRRSIRKGSFGKLTSRYRWIMLPLVFFISVYILYVSQRTSAIDATMRRDPQFSVLIRDGNIRAARAETDKVNKEPVHGLYGLVARRLREEEARVFTFVLDEGGEEGRADWERVGEERVVIRGSSLSALAKALARFYEVNANCSLLSWSSVVDKDRCRIEIPLVLTQAKGSVKSMVRWRYYLNQVTYSYSMVWWDWKRWEKELDWMALKGINLALAHVGQESIWERVFRQFDPGFDRDTYFTGPAYLSWNRMGNLKRLATPLNSKWMVDQLALNHRILARMNALGIVPILPAFNGHVPDSFKHFLPRNEFTLSSYWSGFNSTYSGVVRLEAESPMFIDIGRAIVRAQLDEYGIYLANLAERFYSTDTFNEMDPDANTDLARLGGNLFLSVSREDAKGVLVMQMWCFAHAPRLWTLGNIRTLLAGIPAKKLVLLDLHGDKRPQWSRLQSYLDARPGLRVIWTLLHNFGGTNGMAGEMHSTATALLAAVRNGKASGVGLAMEGTQQNAILYDMVLDLAWHKGAGVDFSLDQWMERWVVFRYSVSDERLQASWRCLLDTVYSRPDEISGWGNTKSVFELQPQLRMLAKGFQPTAIAYQPEELLRCVQQFVSAVSEKTDSSKRNVDDLWYDLIDIIRQACSDVALQALSSIRQAFFKSDRKVLRHVSIKFLAVMKVLNQLMQQHPSWTVEEIALPRWTLESSSYYDHHVRQAKTLITQWSPHTKALHSYSSRQLSGLMELYLLRWKAFFALLSRRMFVGQSLTFEDHERLFEEYTALENNWIRNTTSTRVRRVHLRPQVIRGKAQKLYSRLGNLMKSIHVDEG